MQARRLGFVLYLCLQVFYLAVVPNCKDTYLPKSTFESVFSQWKKKQYKHLFI